MKNIKYLSKVAIFDNCSYITYSPYAKNNITVSCNLQSLIDEIYKCFTRRCYRYITKPFEITIHNLKPEPSSFRTLKGLPIKKAKYELSKRASVRKLFLDINKKSILMESFYIEDLNGYDGIFAFDYELLYSKNKPKDLPINTLYDSDIMYDYNRKTAYSNANLSCKNPMIVTDVDIENINRDYYDGYDLIYGYRGFFLRSYPGDCVDVFEIYDYEKIIPYSYISEFKHPRPAGIYNRYKIEFSGNSTQHVSYVDTIGTLEDAINIFCNDLNLYRDLITNIMLLPDGQWI